VLSIVTEGFRNLFAELPPEVQKQAVRCYKLWRRNPHHPSLQFKQVSPNQPVYSVRIGLNYRALGLWEGNRVTWFWIGSYSDDDRIVRRQRS
jgi:hypothetical protein